MKITAIIILVCLAAGGAAAQADGKTGGPTAVPAAGAEKVAGGQGNASGGQSGEAAGEPKTFSPVSPGRAALGRALFGLAQLVFTFVLAVSVVYGSYRLLGLLVRGLDATGGLAAGNTAVGIMLASFLFGIVLLMKRSLYPVFAVLKDLSHKPETGLAAWGGAALWVLVYVGISFAVALAIALASLWLFDRLTREIKELEEIRRGNAAAAVFFSGVFLSMAFFMESGLHGLLVALIPGMNIRLP